LVDLSGSSLMDSFIRGDSDTKFYRGVFILGIGTGLFADCVHLLYFRNRLGKEINKFLHSDQDSVYKEKYYFAEKRQKIPEKFVL